MGSPLSPLLSDVYMDHFENNIFNNSNFTHYFKYYYRYVDDVICLWSGDVNSLDSFMIYLNSVNNNIKFTYELQSENKLNFLDLQINIINNKPDFSIFRRTTHTGQVIDNNYH